MRKTKGFTPELLERVEREGRGTGTHEQYKAWHQVRRSEPSSLGLSHWHIWGNRQRDLLSNGELLCQMLISMLEGVVDCLEQYPLSLEEVVHPLIRFGQGNPLRKFPGTIAIAEDLGIKHPKTRSAGRSEYWRPSSDFLVIWKDDQSTLKALAIAWKPSSTLSKRQLQLLELELEYWRHREVEWLLATPDLVDSAFAVSLMSTACWTRKRDSSEEDRRIAAQIVSSHPYQPQSALLRQIESQLGSQDRAQRALWQAIWYGPLYVDLRRELKPHLPFRLISHEEFCELNPIASRRSSWI
jgi:hypothetical protein